MPTPPNLRAEQSYQWVDKAGNTVYGSKPPADALEVKEFKTRALSTYSSETAISRMEPEVLEEDFSSDSQDNSAEIIEKSSGMQLEKELQPGPVQKTVLSNESEASYSVEIRNRGEKTASNIKVAFRFSDAYIVETNGPTILGPNDVANYTLPRLLVPVTNIPVANTGSATEKAEIKESENSEKIGAEILPEVEISYDAAL